MERRVIKTRRTMEAERKERRHRQNLILAFKIGLATVIVSGAILVGMAMAEETTREYDYFVNAILAEDHPHDIVVNEEPKEEMVIISETPGAPWNGYEDSSFMEKVEPKHYSEEDLEYLTKLLTGECQGLSYDDQLLYGSVCINRVNDPSFPNTVKDVCLDKRYGIQYASFYDGNANRTATEISEKAAEYLLENGSVAPANVIYQAEFEQGSGTWKKCGRTYFCYK